MISVVFHLPAVYPGGHHIHTHLLEDLLDEVNDFAGGLSVFQGMGSWRNPEGEYDREPIYRVVVGVEEHQVNSLVSLIEERLKGRFEQKAVWLEIDGTP
jgi:hypothetical protein